MSQDPMHFLVETWKADAKKFDGSIHTLFLQHAAQLEAAIQTRPRSSAEDREHVLRVTKENEGLRAELTQAVEQLKAAHSVLLIVREHPDFDAGGPMPDLIDSAITGGAKG